MDTKIRELIRTVLLNLLRKMIRLGTVSNISGSKARVIFKDMDNMTSGWLYVLRHPGISVTVGGASVGETHNHSASISNWMPKVNDTVLVLYLPVFSEDSDGFILGVI